MLPNDLKKTLQKDVESLKTLDLEIIPARVYYRDLLLGWLLVYVLFLGPQFMACFLATLNNAWENERLEQHIDFMKGFDESHDFFEFTAPINEEWHLKMDYPHASRKEIESMILTNQNAREKAKLKKNAARAKAYQKEREEAKLVRTFKMVAGIIFSSLFFTLLFFTGKIKNYVIFKHQLQPRLQTGNYLVRKIKTAFFGFFIFFGFLSLVTIPIFDQDMTFFAGIAAFLISAIGTSILIEMETSRIGLSVLSDVISQYFDKSKNKSENGNETKL